jgi:hypothetical protein
VQICFHRLCGHLRTHGLLVDCINVSIEEHIAMFMKFVGHRWTNRSVGFEFLRSGETVSRYFNVVGWTRRWMVLLIPECLAPLCNAPNFAVEFFLFFTRQNSGVTFSFSFSLR